MRISDWGSDVCSSDLGENAHHYYVAVVQLGALVHGRDWIDDGGERSAAEARLRAGLERLWSPHRGVYTAIRDMRSEERRVGEECVSTCRDRWSPDHLKKNNKSKHYQHKTKQTT